MNSSILQFHVAVFYIVCMDGAEALQGWSGERDAGRVTDVLHFFHMTDAPLEDTAHESPMTLF